MKRLILLLPLLALAMFLTARPYNSKAKIPYPDGRCYIFRVQLKDKSGTAFSLARPEEFLSQRSLYRRERQGLRLDSTDLPVSARYLSEIRRRGFDVVGQSKWNNTVLIKIKNLDDTKGFGELPFVKGWRKVWTSPDSVLAKPERDPLAADTASWERMPGNYYGNAQHQIEMLGGDKLHMEGFRGKGMVIAVMDAGYMNVDRIEAFRGVDILGTHNFVATSGGTVYDHMDHGTEVLSTMAVNRPERMVGTAPEASFWLLRSEDDRTEALVEEDYWAEAAEFADSVGADIISSSLGYYYFDDKSTSHQYKEQNGHTALISHTASLLVEKGIVEVNSAGNAGSGTWKKIGFPADAIDNLAVGAVDKDSVNTVFSSIGNTADGRIKPDVCAMGLNTALVDGSGELTYANGTSFSCPTVAGMVACLWQALPHKTARNIVEIVRLAGNNVMHPDNIYGYGIPDFFKAYEMERE